MKTLSLPKPHMIVVLGVPGSGKTFFAKQFAKTFHAPYVHYNKILKLSGSSATAARKLAVYQIHELLKTNQSIVLEGLSDVRTDRTELMKIAQSAGYETLLVWVQTDPVAAKQRAIKPPKDSDSQPISPTRFDTALRQFVVPHASEPVVVISGKHTYASQAKVVLKKLTIPHALMATQLTTSRPIQPDTNTRHPKAKNASSLKTNRQNIAIK